MSGTYKRLSAKNFYPAIYLEEQEDNASVRYRGARVFSERKPAIVLPLREGDFGAIRPHIYANLMQDEDKTKEPGTYNLTRVHGWMSSLFRKDGYTYDPGTEGVGKFIHQLEEWSQEGNNRAVRLLADVRENAEKYYNIRAARQREVAKSLTQVIGGKNLYLVGHNHSDAAHADRYPSYAVPLVGMMNVRKGSQMMIEPLVRDALGAIGLLSTDFYVPAGVSAPVQIKRHNSL